MEQEEKELKCLRCCRRYFHYIRYTNLCAGLIFEVSAVRGLLRMVGDASSESSLGIYRREKIDRWGIYCHLGYFETYIR